MNRFQAIALFTDYAFEKNLTSWEIDQHFKAYSHRYEELGKLIANTILEEADTMPRELVEKAEDLTFVPAA